MKATQRVAGFTMLEVLISIVVIAFGLLGVAGLQAYALKNNSSATQRLAATALATDMIDRMKTNHAGVSAGAYNRPNVGDYNSPVASCNTGGSCTPVQLAQNDRFEWAQRVAATLPGGSGVVCGDSTPNDGADSGNPACEVAENVHYVVKIWWRDDRTTANAPLQRFWTAFNP